MLLRKEIRLFFLLMFLAFSGIAGNISNDVSGNDTIIAGISQDETILFNMINDMRRQNKLPSIPLSLDLCKVAQIHIADLIKWKPQEKGCSLHSWSGSGKWTSCCNTKEVFGIQCMKSKPREITGYLGDGYELIYWGEDNAIPAEAAALWKEVGASSDMILSKGKWSGYQWKALGAGIKSGYAVLWLGDAVSTNTTVIAIENKSVEQNIVTKPEVIAILPETEKKSTKPEVPVKQKTPASNLEINQRTNVSNPAIKEKHDNLKGPKFYLIVGSYKDFEGADSELKKLKQKGYPSVFILYQEPLYRISILSFEESEKAFRMKNELKATFPGIWIYKK
jgi:hypothetical protein